MLPDKGADLLDDGFDPAAEFLSRMNKGADEATQDDEDEVNTTESETEDTTDPEETLEPVEDDGSDEEPEADEADEDDESSDDDDEDKGKSKPKSKDASDDLIVKVKVDGVEHPVSVKDLKRLYGQETALNRKSQEVADARKKIEEVAQKQATALTAMYERAQKRAAPYANIDFFALAKDPNISAEELTALRQEAQSAFDDVNFYGQELDNVLKQTQAQRIDTLRSQAVECMKALSDPNTGIKGWNKALYDDLRSYAVSSGLPPQIVNELVDASAWKLLHKAMQFDKGSKALSNTTKVIKTPKKIIKTSHAPVTKTDSSNKPNDRRAMDRLAKSGDADDAAAVFAARMGVTL